MDVNRVITSDEIKSTQILRDQLKTIEANYPTVHFEEVAAAADFTQKSLDGVLQNLIEGIILTAVVLMLFLHAWRNALVVMIAIPTSLLSTFIVMRLMHFTVDTISLMGLSLIIGILVDDSIVVLENITGIEIWANPHSMRRYPAGARSAARRSRLRRSMSSSFCRLSFSPASSAST